MSRLRMRTSALVIVVAALPLGALAACAAPQAASAGPSKAASSAAPFSLASSGFGTAGMGAVCPLDESGANIQVTFTVDLGDVAAECAAAGQQLSTTVGGTWQEANQEDFSLPLACAVLHHGTSVVIRDSAGSPRGELVCHRLIAAGWTEDPSTEQLLRNIVMSTAS